MIWFEQGKTKSFAKSMYSCNSVRFGVISFLRSMERIDHINIFITSLMQRINLYMGVWTDPIFSSILPP